MAAGAAGQVVLWRMRLCLALLYPAELEHDSACDYIGHASENLGKEILLEARMPSKF